MDIKNQTILKQMEEYKRQLETPSETHIGRIIQTAIEGYVRLLTWVLSLEDDD